MPQSGISPDGTLIPSPLPLLSGAFIPFRGGLCLSPFPSCPINLFFCTSASRCAINNLEPVFMDSAISAAFKPIAFLQRLHEGFLLLQSFCFIYSPSPSSLPVGAATPAGSRAGAVGCHGLPREEGA